MTDTGIDAPVRTIDYTKMRSSKARGMVIEKCPTCGRKGRRINMPITRGKDIGRVRVQFQHKFTFVDLGVMRLGRGDVSCFVWADEMPAK